MWTDYWTWVQIPSSPPNMNYVSSLSSFMELVNIGVKFYTFLMNTQIYIFINKS